MIPLAAGCGAGVFAFSKLMVTLLERYEMALSFCFIGLILGSIPMIYRRARYAQVKGRNLAVFFLCLAFMLTITILGGGELSNRTLAQMGGMSLPLALWLAASAAVSVVGMILPGISGSFVMLLLGVYAVALEAVANLNLPVLLPLCAGGLLGGVIGVKFIKNMLRFHPQALYFAILGLITGSIFTIWPGWTAGPEGFLSLALAVCFASLAYFFSRRSA